MTKGLAFLSKKKFHTGTLENTKRVWEAEQKAEAERMKIEELKKERDVERKQEELEKMASQPVENIEQWIDQNFTRAQPKKVETKPKKSKGLNKLKSPINKSKPNVQKESHLDEGLNKNCVLKMTEYQEGVLTECRDHAYYVVNGADSEVKTVIKKLPELLREVAKIDEKAGLECVLGLGYKKTKEWFADKRFPRAMVEFRGKTGSMPATGGDILLHIKCNRVDLCFELANRFYKSIPSEFINNVEETFGYVYMKSNFGKDLTGFEDGPANPSKEEERKEAALIGKDDPNHEGGSYCLLQKWVHNLDKFNSVPVSEQEQIIGRTKGNDSKKIKPKPANAHTTRTDVKENDKELKTVRQSTPFGGIKEHGLVFISYSSTPHKFERQLSRMVGEDEKEGPSDRMLEFSKPVTGNYFFVPSIKVMSNL